MYRNAYLLLFCIAILSSLTYSEFKKMKGSPVLAQINDISIAQANSALDIEVESPKVVDTIDESILLDNEEQKKISEIVSTTSQKTAKTAKTTKKSPSAITAEEYLVGNLETGEIYLETNSTKVFPIASVSKLYTALVVHHLFDLEKRIEINEQMLKAYGNSGNLQVGEKLLPNELLYALLMESSNDAAEAFAHSYGYTDFIDQMNAFAKEIGMSKTSFRDASGLSAGNVSNAKDLFTLAKYMYASEKDILDISKTAIMNLDKSEEHLAHHFVNINPFSKNPNFFGGKTGRTDEARESMVSLFNKTVNGVDYPIVVIVLRSDFGERETNSEKLINMFVEKQLKK